MASDAQDAPIDVLIAGAGPVGLTLGLALARLDLRVGLMDARDPAAGIRAEPRAYLIAAGCWRILEGLGVAPRLRVAAEPVMRVENCGGGGAIAFGVDDAAEPDALGWMIESDILTRGLGDAVREDQRITVLAPRRLEGATLSDPFAIAMTDRGPLRARLLAACDGVRSGLRAAAGIRFEGRDHGYKAVSTFVTLPSRHAGVARQRFVQQGPLALLPLPGDRGNLVWTVKAPVADALLAMPADRFVAELARAGEGFASGLRLDGPRAAFPVGLHIAEVFHQHRLALVGDAAHQVPPLAGQGLNLGLRDAAALADVVRETMLLGLDIGSAAQLEGYSRWRRPDAVATGAAMEALMWTFSAGAPVRAAAGLAMSAAGRIGPMRRWFARSATGSEGDTPSLMRVA
jgi:2-octaprenyl-6-methoxyphenol hydroxylase